MARGAENMDLEKDIINNREKADFEQKCTFYFFQSVQ